MNTNVMFSSKTDAWATPKAFFAELDKEFHFDLDPCADEFNHKCEKYYTIADNGLLKEWVEKAFRTNEDHGNLVVMLLPARTDTKWFHDYIYHKAEIRFIRGRLKFGDSKNSAPFPSMVVVYGRKGN